MSGQDTRPNFYLKNIIFANYQVIHNICDNDVPMCLISSSYCFAVLSANDGSFHFHCLCIITTSLYVHASKMTGDLRIGIANTLWLKFYERLCFN